MRSRPPASRWSTDLYDVDDPDHRDEQLIERLYGTLRPALWWYFRPRIEGLDRVPKGACLFVGNHNGAMLMMDMFILGVALYERFGLEGLPWGMGHRLAIRLPLFHQLLPRLGAVRGTGENGLKLLRQDRKVLVYPGGELDSMRTYWDRKRVVFGERRGYLRLAIRAGVPIVPVVTAGAHETLWVLNDGQRLARLLGLDRKLNLRSWPLTLSVPWGLWLGIPPPHFPLRTRVKVEILPPIELERSGDAAAQDRAYLEDCHRRVHSVMQRTLERLSDEPNRDGAR